MIPSKRWTVAVAVTLLALAAAPAGSQEGHTAHGGAPVAAMPLYRSVTGPYSFPVTTRSVEAQAYFDQGVQLLFAFTPRDAVRSFLEAQRLDPDCAMCFWAEAWARGPYFNGVMSASDAPLAHAAVQRAREIGLRNTPPRERSLIDALAARYTHPYDPAVRRGLDERYAQAMAAVYDTYPRDHDIATLYAESLMLLEPRRGTWVLEDPKIQRIHRVLEGVLSENPDHPGACHLYVHATESTTRPDKAEICADQLVLAIPGASHINHMPSHTYNRVGRWKDSVNSNILAWHSDQRAAWDEGFAIYPAHNLHMLLFAAAMDGQGAISTQAARDYARINGPGGNFYVAMTLLRFGRFDEILELVNPPEEPLFRALFDFSRGIAHLRRGNEAEARAHLDRLEAARSSLPPSTNFRGHSAANLLGITGAILQAEILREAGALAEAIPLLERAVEIEAGLTYDEPEPLVFATRHFLGAALLEAGRPADAERVYLADLQIHPHNGWSLFGLEQALRQQLRDGDADAVRERFEAAWARSEVLLRASRF